MRVRLLSNIKVMPFTMLCFNRTGKKTEMLMALCQNTMVERMSL